MDPKSFFSFSDEDLVCISCIVYAWDMTSSMILSPYHLNEFTKQPIKLFYAFETVIYHSHSISWIDSLVSISVL
jgi:hypothetical protein